MLSINWLLWDRPALFTLLIVTRWLHRKLNNFWIRKDKLFYNQFLTMNLFLHKTLNVRLVFSSKRFSDNLCIIWGKGVGEWITDRVYKVTSCLIKFFVEYMIPYLWTVRENRLQKIQLVPCSEQTESDHAGIHVQW